MNILDLFKTTPAPAQQQQQQQQQATPATPPNQGNIPAAPTVVVDPNNPAAPAVDPTAPAVPDTPLADYAELWQNKPSEDGKPAAPTALNQEDVSKAMANVDFTSALNADSLAAIGNGGEEAIKALPQLLNAVAKQVMVQSTMVNNTLTEKAVAAAVAEQQDAIPALVRAQATNDHMLTENPLFKNPAIQPVMEATRSQLLTKFPAATPAEITKMTQDYITQMGQAFNPAPDPKALQPGETDWTKFTGQQ